ncbi:MAG: bifunctional diaminohydroxyphosphoribosylaminopyrimidine deaminase/5-amino-6-(5-phosphoribosylamino)uracil reductase RibD, partial [Chitinophagales bacterium]
MDHSLYMRRCLEIAAKGAESVAPNPLVGAVIVYAHQVIAEGYHAFYGGPHAEVAAIRQALESGFDKFSDATLYVNLEPCVHFGKTPPCVDLILEKGFRHVVISQPDPNPLVAGKGIQKLKEAGVHVECNICLPQATALNRKFNVFHTKHRPYVLLKWAQSNDLFIAKEDYTPVKLTHHLSDVYVHMLRAQNMSICVGGRTVISDNPQLNVRLWKGKSPTRV